MPRRGKLIISFEVENFRSIHERQVLSFVASSLKDCEDGIIETPAFGEGRLLPALLLYGANASGKTNIVRAFNSMIGTVLYSQTRGQPGGSIPTRIPFMLSEATANEPTVFEINFILDDVRYNYGFSFSEKSFHEEWLFSYPHGTPRKLFERKYQEFSFGRHLKGKNVTIAELTRENSLFLSAAAQSGHEHLTDLYNFFDSIQVETSLSVSGHAAERRIKEEHQWKIDDDVIRFLTEINTGIVGYRTKAREISEEERELTDKLNLAVKSVISEVKSDIEFRVDSETEKVIELEHKGRDGERKHFPIHMESAGTLRLLSALPKVLGVLKLGGIVVIDELDLSLHTHASEKLLELFCSRKTNPKGAQLFATTHDTNLLESRCLRRDQVWFVAKSSDGGSEVYPLTDIRTRRSDNIEKGYLQGRFGATPGDVIDNELSWQS